METDIVIMVGKSTISYLNPKEVLILFGIFDHFSGTTMHPVKMAR